MSLLERYLRLLASVLPVIQKSVITDVNRATVFSEPWMEPFLTSLHAEILHSQTRIEKLQFHLDHIKSNSRTLKLPCESALKHLLVTIEVFTSTEKSDEAQLKPAQTFPQLERIKQGHRVPKVLIHPPTIHESKIILEGMQTATRPLPTHLEPLAQPQTRTTLNLDDSDLDLVPTVRLTLAELK